MITSLLVGLTYDTSRHFPHFFYYSTQPAKYLHVLYMLNYRIRFYVQQSEMRVSHLLCVGECICWLNLSP